MNIDKMNEVVKPPESVEVVAERFRATVRPLEELRKRGLSPLASHQKLEGGALTPDSFVIANLEPMEREDCPNVLFMAPHGGEYAPENLFERLTEEGQRSTAVIDAGTFFITQSERVPSLATGFSRFCGFDLNRRPPEEAANVAAPGSFIWERTMTGASMYKPGQEPTETEREYLSKKYHARYYKEVGQAVHKLSERRKSGERVLMLDVHAFVDPNSQNASVTSLLKRYLPETDLTALKESNPIFVLSDRKGFSCDDDVKNAFVEALQTNFEALSEREKSLLLEGNASKEVVAVEKWFTAGGYNAEYGDKLRKSGQPWVNALQLEINPTAFVAFDPVGGFENATYNDEKLAIMKRLLEQVVLDVNKSVLSAKGA